MQKVFPEPQNDQAPYWIACATMQKPKR